MLKAARDQVLLPALDASSPSCARWRTLCAVPMLSRTHGQTASPTTVGKEIANVVVRLAARARSIAAVQAAGQDERRRGQLQRPPVGLARLRLGGLQPQGHRTPEPLGLGLTFQPYSIQIEPHDYMAELFDAVARANTILIDWSRDVWGYVAWATSSSA
jgi:adenylosuccinate lyase